MKTFLILQVIANFLLVFCTFLLVFVTFGYMIFTWKMAKSINEQVKHEKRQSKLRIKPILDARIMRILSSGTTFKLGCRVLNAGFSPFKIQYIVFKFFLTQMPGPLYADIKNVNKYLRPGDDYINDEITFDVKQMMAPELRSLESIKDVYLRYHFELLDLANNNYSWPENAAEGPILFVQ